MKFDYTKIGEAYFPLVDVELIYKKNSVITKGYINSGASHSIFKSGLAEILKLDFKKGKRMYPADIGGHICAYLNEIKIKVGDIKFDAKILFSDEFVVRFNLLGRLGLFEQFKVCFDERNKFVELIKG